MIKISLIGVLINFIDITERKKMEETLIRKDKMESLGFLLLNIAHELRNPLPVLRTLLNLYQSILKIKEFKKNL